MWRGYFIMFFGSCCCTYMSAFTYVLPKVNRPSHRTCASSLHGGEGKEARCSVVALTRSLQENHNLASLLHARALSTIQLPCIQFQAGPDASLLRDCLQQERFDFTLLTSPQAARVYVQALQTLGEDAMRRNSKVIGIGPGTSVVLQGCGIETLFTPTLPNAITLASEIPLSFGSKVLYPTSTLASHDLQSSLELRGFEVRRLNAYNTVESDPWNPSTSYLASAVKAIAFSSPSAVHAWLHRVGNTAAQRHREDNFVFAIGKTTADAAMGAGFQHVSYPNKPTDLVEFAEHISSVCYGRE